MNKKALLLAEKPDMLAKIKFVYDKYGHDDDISFMAFRGHITRLYEPHEYDDKWSKWDLNTLPIIPDEFKYKADESKIKLYNDIAKEVKSGNYDYIICATDPRQGRPAYFLRILGEY